MSRCASLRAIPLDEVVLRSYCIGAADMALGWVLTEGIAVSPDTGDVLDLTIRSFGIIRPARTPPIDVVIIDDPGEPQPHASDAVFAAVAAATWNAVTDARRRAPRGLARRQHRGGPRAAQVASSGYPECYVRRMAGAIVFAVAMVLVVPIAVMFGGAIWSGVFGWLSSDNADDLAANPPPPEDASAAH